jgi:site-specific DNA recombinase
MITALYARVSKKEQASDSNALTRQIWQLKREGASRDGYLEFVDIQTGRRDDRPQFQEMLKAIEAGEIGEVIVTRIDRITRDLETNTRLCKFFERKGIQLYELLIGRNLDTKGNPNDWEYFARSGVKAESESRMLSARIKQTNAWHREIKRPLGGRLALGYRRNGHTAEPDPDSWDTAVRIVQLYIEEGGALRTTLIRVREELGIDRSQVWLHDWLRNPFLRGHTIYDTRDEFGNKKRVSEPRTIVRDTHPSLFSDPRLFEIGAEQILERLFLFNKRKKGNARKRPSYPLSGLCYCGRCGAIMHVRTVSKNGISYTYLMCSERSEKGKPCGGPYKAQQGMRMSSSTRYPDADSAVLEALRKRSRELVLFAATEEQIRLEVQPDSEEIRSLKAKIAQLEQMNDADLKDAIEGKRLKLKELLLDRSSPMKISKQQQDLMVIAQEPYFWEDLGDELKNSLYANFVERVECDREAIDVILKI